MIFMLIGGFKMPYDGAFISSVISEISTLVGCKIEKIHQPSKDEIILIFKKDRRNVLLLISANPSYPRVHITEQAKENPKIPPTFCMMLRKHLLDGKLISVNQVNFDRIIELKIQSKDELGYNVEYKLISEIMGKHSNILLLDTNNRIVDCIKHIGSNMNRYREILPGSDYVIPPIKGKISPINAEMDTLNDILNKDSEKTVSSIISDSFLGISKLFSREICGVYKDIPLSKLSGYDRDIISSSFYYYIAKIKSHDFKHMIFFDSSGKYDYYIMPIEEYKKLFVEYYDTPGKLLDAFYSQKDLKDTLKQRNNDLFKLVSGLIDKNNKKIQICYSRFDECKDYQTLKMFGDLIIGNQYKINSNMDNVEVENFYSPDFDKIEIPLEIGLTPIENANKYYKKYNKEKKTIEVSKKQLEEANYEKEYLDTIIFNLENASDIATIEDIKRELWEMGYVKKKKFPSKVQKSSPYHYRSKDGFDIYVGKNNNQNDYLTTKFAVGSDIWMHTKNIPGSHVIIKSKNGYVSDTVLIDGARLAAYYSKGRDSENVPVDYTEKKNVKKPSGAKPGMVIYYTNKTIYVTPDEKLVHEMESDKF